MQCGNFQTLSSVRQPFQAWRARNATEFYDGYCNYTYGHILNGRPPKSQYTNTVYGGRSIAADNISFAQGSLDPWSRAGILEGASLYPETSFLYYVDKGSHCQASHSPETFFGSESLVRVRNMLALDIQFYLQGRPWAHFLNGRGAGASSLSLSKQHGSTALDGCAFDVVVKRTKPVVKRGEQVKVCM